MFNKLLVSVLAFLLIGIIPCYSQLKWTQYSALGTEGGLGSNDVYAIVVEPNSDGKVVWCGSRPNSNYGWDGGLSKFDMNTNTWTNFTTDNSDLPHNWIMDMEFDSQGNLWLATKGGGLAKVAPPYGSNNWTSYGDGSGLGYVKVYEIAIDSVDNIWLGHGPPPPDDNPPKAMSVFNGNSTWQTFGTPTFGENSTYSIVIDNEGNKWCATKTKGISMLDDGGTPFITSDDNWTHITSGILPFSFNSNAGENVNGDLWFGHDVGGGADVWNGTSWSNHKPDRWFRTITQDWQGNVWCGEKRGHSEAMGIFIYDGENWENLTESDGLPWNVLNAITIDNLNGNVWIGHGNPGYTDGGLTLLEGKVPPQANAIETLNSSVARKFHLAQNYPNPFNPQTTIEYSLQKSDLVKLAIYDNQGQLVKHLVNEYQNPNSYSITWDGTNENGKLVSSGLYFYTLRAGNKVILSKQMILIK